MIAKFILALAFCTLICACKTTNKGSTNNPAISGIIIDESFRKPLNDKELYAAITIGVPLDSVYVSKDTLHVLTKRIQACSADNLKLIWNGMMKKSLPPQVDLKIFQAGDANCKQQRKVHLQYNLASFRYKNDTIASKATIIRLAGWKDALKYNF